MRSRSKSSSRQRPGPGPSPAVAFVLMFLGLGCTRANPAYMLGQRSDGGASDVQPVSNDRTDARTFDFQSGSGERPEGGRSEVQPASDAGNATPACGTAVLDVSSVVRSDGVAIGDDGTLYFTGVDAVDGWIGRVVGLSVQPRWLRVPAGLNPRGLVIDHARQKLYLADDGLGSILAYDLPSPAATGVVVVSGLAGINDLALDAAGTIYFSGSQSIYRVAQGRAEIISVASVGDIAKDQGPGGLAFAADGGLIVGIRKGGPVIRMTLASGVEGGRTNFGSFDGWANGLALDRSGRLYVGIYDLSVNTSVMRIASDGSTSAPVAGGGRFASLAFGRGPLDCHDLYVANVGGAMLRLRTDTLGLTLP
jgi:hypothetical protein